MLGRGTGGPSFAGVSSDVRVWNNINPLGANGSAFVTASAAQAAGVFELTNRNNMAVWLCDKLARTQLDTVDLTLVALGGGQISYWAPGEVTWPMLNECTSVWAATSQGPADVFFWHQGEADLATAPSSYRSQFEALLTNLIAAGVISASTIILLGGIAENTAQKISFNRDCLFPLSERPLRAYVNSYGLVTVGDAFHFSGPDLAAFGYRRAFSSYLFARGK